jgi:hypothetical protein
MLDFKLSHNILILLDKCKMLRTNCQILYLRLLKYAEVIVGVEN